MSFLEMIMSSDMRKSHSRCSAGSESAKLGSTRGIKPKEVSESARKLAASSREINKTRSHALENEKSLRCKDKSHGQVPRSDPCLTFVTEIEERLKTERGYGIRNRLKYVSTGLAAAKELLKVLSRFLKVDRHPSSAMALVSALRLELDRGHYHVDQLLKDDESNFLDEFDHALKLFEEEKATWRRMKREKIRCSLTHIAEDLEMEKKLRKQTERLNKKVGRELADTKASLLKLTKELENEKRAKHILGELCDQLASGVGEDRAVAEKIKRQSAKVRKEVEREREMLHWAHVLREERVQMKLSEAKYQFEEKTAAVDMLRNELETYLKKKQDEDDGTESSGYDRVKELEAYLKEIKFVSCKRPLDEQNEEGLRMKEMLLAGDDSPDSDLHSIELNMDINSKSYKWRIASDAGTPPLEKNIKGRRSTLENSQWDNTCGKREKPTTNTIIEHQLNPDLSIRGRSCGSASQIQDDENEKLNTAEFVNHGAQLLPESKLLSANGAEYQPSIPKN